MPCRNSIVPTGFFILNQIALNRYLIQLSKSHFSHMEFCFVLKAPINWMSTAIYPKSIWLKAKICCRSYHKYLPTGIPYSAFYVCIKYQISFIIRIAWIFFQHYNILHIMPCFMFILCTFHAVGSIWYFCLSCHTHFPSFMSIIIAYRP